MEENTEKTIDKAIDKATDKKECLLLLSFQVPLQLFQKFSILNTAKTFEKRIKKNNLTSIFKLGLAFMVAVWVIMTPNKNQFVVMLAVILMALGIYSFMYYRVLFPKIIAKTAKEGYEKSPYLTHTVQIRFFSTHMEETSQETTNIYRWQDIKRYISLEDMLLLELSTGRTMIIPKKEIGDDRFMLEELMKTVSVKYSKTIETAY